MKKQQENGCITLSGNRPKHSYITFFLKIRYLRTVYNLGELAQMKVGSKRFTVTLKKYYS